MTEFVSGPPAGFKDRSSALVGVGVLVVVLGGVAALFAALVAVVGLLGSASGIAARPAQLLPTVLTYIIVAAAFVWLGIGSIKARRWARALLLIVSWLWLISGVVGIALMAWTLPAAFTQPQLAGGSLSDGCAGTLVVAIVVVMAVFFVALPGLLVLFYRSPHVKATCEARDPVQRWTDACPMPVLGMSFMLGAGAAFMLVMVVPYHGMFPLFGQFVSGIPGAALTIAAAALTAYCARAVYRLDLRGWWVLLAASAAGAVSATLTLARADLLEMYRLMGYSTEDLALLQPFLGRYARIFGPLMAVNGLLWFGYLLHMRKHFKRERSE